MLALVEMHPALADGCAGSVEEIVERLADIAVELVVEEVPFPFWC